MSIPTAAAAGPSDPPFCCLSATCLDPDCRGPLSKAEYHQDVWVLGVSGFYRASQAARRCTRCHIRHYPNYMTYNKKRFHVPREDLALPIWFTGGNYGFEVRMLEQLRIRTTMGKWTISSEVLMWQQLSISKGRAPMSNKQRDNITDHLRLAYYGWQASEWMCAHPEHGAPFQLEHIDATLGRLNPLRRSIFLQEWRRPQARILVGDGGAKATRRKCCVEGCLEGCSNVSQFCETHRDRRRLEQIPPPLTPAGFLNLESLEKICNKSRGKITVQLVGEYWKRRIDEKLLPQDLIDQWRAARVPVYLNSSEKTSEGFDCNVCKIRNVKMMTSRTGGVYVMCYGDKALGGLVSYYGEMASAETKELRVAALLGTMTPHISCFIHDDACSIRKYVHAEKEAARHFSADQLKRLHGLLYIVDPLHFVGHSGIYCARYCSPAIHEHRAWLDLSNPSVCEQTFSWLHAGKKSLCQMAEPRFNWELGTRFGLHNLFLSHGSTGHLPKVSDAIRKNWKIRKSMNDPDDVEFCEIVDDT